MKSLYTLLLLSLSLTSHLFAQQKTSAIPTNKLIGTWRLIEFADLDQATSKWTYSYRKNQQGYFIYIYFVLSSIATISSGCVTHLYSNKYFGIV
ncbi:MAG: hypothetical protein JST96_06075 [Bacteroidetes bacterium]|nr:hypothetical protein [Bacteroidota bacterium]